MSSRSLSHIAYHRIRERLFSSEFSPSERISETALASQLGVSRTPVREAIRRLQSEGLLHQIPRSGTFVTQPDRNGLCETYEVRKALECMAIRKATKLMTSNERGQLQFFCDQMLAAITAMRDSGSEILDGDSLQRYLKADLAFHLLLLRAADNRLAMKIVADSRMRDSIFSYRSHGRNLHHVARVWLVHARIARAVRRRDAKAAQYWLSRHIRDSLRDALAAFDKHISATTPQHGPAVAVAESLDKLVGQLMDEVGNQGPEKSSA